MGQIQKVPFFAFVLLGALQLFSTQSVAQTTLSFREAVSIVRDSTQYRFIYRSAAVSGLMVKHSSTIEELIHEITVQLRTRTLEMKWDSLRSMIYIVDALPSAPLSKFELSGTLLDATTQQPIAWAFVQFGKQTSYTGADGAFIFHYPSTQTHALLQFSHLGYESRSFEIPITQSFKGLSLTLPPKTYSSPAVLVEASGLRSAVTSTFISSTSQAFQPTGTTNSLRPFSLTPAISLTPLMSTGFNIRGSKSDAFLILLDDTPIFNPFHLFGAMDSFNQPALQSGLLMTGITPSYYTAPGGGVLILSTKSGSANNRSSLVDLSNSAFSATIGDSFGDDLGTWLISARHSLFDVMPSSINDELISFGLNTNRRRITEQGASVTEELDVGKPEAQFYDVHLSTSIDVTPSFRLKGSLYLGGDRAFSTVERSYPGFTFSQTILPEENSTEQQWNTQSGSLQWFQTTQRPVTWSGSMGYTLYNAEFIKEDFLNYSVTTGTSSAFFYPFLNQSSLSHAHIQQEARYSWSQVSFSTGVGATQLLSSYVEESFTKPYFGINQQLWLFEGWHHTEAILGRHGALEIGFRSHFLPENGDFFLSPRVHLNYAIFNYLRLSTGWSRSYQFIHNVEVSSIASSPIWISSSVDQKPASTSLGTLGIEFQPSPSILVKTEWYTKQSDRIRTHEISPVERTSVFSNLPWFANNRLVSRGLENQLIIHQPEWEWMAAYTISSTYLRNPELNDGNSFPAAWDRRHQFSTVGSYRIHPNVTVSAAWMSASGVPDQTGMFLNSRLGAYYRMDLGVTLKRQWKEFALETTVSVFNLLDRVNPWYSEQLPVLTQENGVAFFEELPVQVMDMGRLPSLSMRILF